MTEEGRLVAIDDTELWVVERGAADAVPMSCSTAVPASTITSSGTTSIR